MSTFSDLLMLMLTFFVLLLTMSSLDEQQVRMLTRTGIHIEATRIQSSSVHQQPIAPTIQLKPTVNELEILLETWAPEPKFQQKVKALMETFLVHSGISEGAWVEVRPEGVVVHLDGQVTFEKGTAQLSPQSMIYLESLAPLLRSEVSVQVEHWLAGRGDYEALDDAWDLSLARADRVAVVLRSHGVDDETIRVMGYGFEAGRQEGRFLRQGELLRLFLIIGPPDAEIF